MELKNRLLTILLTLINNYCYLIQRIYRLPIDRFLIGLSLYSIHNFINDTY